MNDLHDKQTSIEFYDARYEHGYMEDWDDAKKMKVREILQSIDLPPTGKVLDFGCGNGVFTNLLKNCLPSWEVYGVEISNTAVLNATKKYPACRFFLADDSHKYNGQFDFLFSHHVIEHVQDLDETFAIIDSYLKPSAYQLHILPCGNEGSLEFTICQLQKNGIEKESGNRFFFEEEGHLQRLTSKQFEDFEEKISFQLVKGFYANQYEGAVNWITKSSPRFVKKLTDYTRAIDENARQQLVSLRNKLLPLTYKQFPYTKYWAIKSKWKKKPKDYLLLSTLFLPALVSKITSDKLDRKATEEWKSKKEDQRGSEMFLFFKR